MSYKFIDKPRRVERSEPPRFVNEFISHELLRGEWQWSVITSTRSIHDWQTEDPQIYDWHTIYRERYIPWAVVRVDILSGTKERKSKLNQQKVCYRPLTMTLTLSLSMKTNPCFLHRFRKNWIRNDFETLSETRSY